MGLGDRRRERRPQEKLERLLDAAARAFGEQGFARTQVESICRLADVSVGTFYQHFSNKAELLQHLVEEVHARARPPSLATKADLEADLEVRRAALSSRIVRAWLEAVEVEPALRPVHDRLHAATVERYAAHVAEARRAAGRSSPLDHAAAGRYLHLLTKDAAVFASATSPATAPDAARVIWYIVFGE